MDTQGNTSFIFYLTLEENLSNSFYAFDRVFKSLGYMLVPVRIDQLQSLVASSEQSQIVVMTSVSDSREMKLYNEKIRGLLKFILKSKRITFMHLGSFSKLNDTKLFALSRNYFFLKYPLNAHELASKIVRYHDLKSEQNSRWPGGKRAGLNSVTA